MRIIWSAVVVVVYLLTIGYLTANGCEISHYAAGKSQSMDNLRLNWDGGIEESMATFSASSNGKGNNKNPGTGNDHPCGNGNAGNKNPHCIPEPSTVMMLLCGCVILGKKYLKSSKKSV